MQKVGVDLRLSREDETTGTSLSIDNQKSIILDYLDSEPLQFTLIDTYIDDGISGITDERPAFKQLIDDVKSGFINCVITKDTSRFTRNVTDAEYYINTLFLTLNTRFIALGSPMIDSYENPESVDGIQFHFESYFNEYYIKMTSKKIRKVFEIKTKKGEFIGPFASYGYKRDPMNKHKLLVDDEAAEIVKKIFSLFVYENLSLRAIALKLNSMGILTPREYKIKKGIIPNSQTMSIPAWRQTTIKVILSDEKYCGHMVQGKRKNISYKIKKSKRQAPENWVIVRNTHEPIISEDLFEKAQILLQRPSRTTKNGEKSIYSSFVYCGNCNHVLSRKQDKKCGSYFHRCGFYEATKKCRPIHIGEKVLNEQLLFAIKSQIVLVTEMDRLKKAILSSNSFIDDSKILKSNLNLLEKEQKRLETKSHRLYDDYSDGVIDKELYISRSALLKKELEVTKDKIAKIKIEMRQFKKVQTVTNDYADRFKKYETVNEITRELLVDLVDRVLVDKVENTDGNGKKQLKHVKVIFKFADEHKALMSFIGENTKHDEEINFVAL